tara:strand:- start:44016 stop:45170 length:1155 start_codon:yes stop_codon:yes gene_type:complete
MFFLTVFSVWAVVHIYVGWRIASPVELSSKSRAMIWLIIVISYMLLPVITFLRLTHGVEPWYSLLFWITFIDGGFILTLVPILLFKDLLMLLIGLTKTIIGFHPTDPSKRAFLARSINGAVLATTAIMTGKGFIQAQKAPTIKSIIIPVDDLHIDLDGLKFTQITDTHVSGSIGRDYIQGIVDLVNSTKPDLVFITGDVVDGLVHEKRMETAPLKHIESHHGTFLVTGNHEYYWDLHGWLEEFSSLGLDTLINSNRIIQRGGAKLMVAGVTDYSAERYAKNHKSDPAKAVNGAPQCDYKIMLAHQPKSVLAVHKTGVNLQLSGHTHGGQFFPWTIVLPLLEPVCTGLSKYKDMVVYVSRGSGYWGPIHRLGSPSEITAFTLKRT